jgi:hypothetical protein
MVRKLLQAVESNENARQRQPAIENGKRMKTT